MHNSSEDRAASHGVQRYPLFVHRVHHGPIQFACLQAVDLLTELGILFSCWIHQAFDPIEPYFNWVVELRIDGEVSLSSSFFRIRQFIDDHFI